MKLIAAGMFMFQHWEHYSWKCALESALFASRWIRRY